MCFCLPLSPVWRKKWNMVHFVSSIFSATEQREMNQKKKTKNKKWTPSPKKMQTEQKEVERKEKENDGTVENWIYQSLQRWNRLEHLNFGVSSSPCMVFTFHIRLSRIHYNPNDKLFQRRYISVTDRSMTGDCFWLAAYLFSLYGRWLVVCWLLRLLLTHPMAKNQSPYEFSLL